MSPWPRPAQRHFGASPTRLQHALRLANRTAHHSLLASTGQWHPCGKRTTRPRQHSLSMPLRERQPMTEGFCHVRRRPTHRGRQHQALHSARRERRANGAGLSANRCVAPPPHGEGAGRTQQACQEPRWRPVVRGSGDGARPRRWPLCTGRGRRCIRRHTSDKGSLGSPGPGARSRSRRAAKSTRPSAHCLASCLRTKDSSSAVHRA